MIERITRDEGLEPLGWRDTPIFSDAIGRVARASREAGDWMLAARMAGLMNEHDPAYAGTHYALALSAEHDGNLPTAKREFGLALAAWAGADPDLPEVATARKAR